MRKFQLPPCMPNDVLTCGLEWKDRPISRQTVNRLRSHCEAIGKLIAADWLADAKLQAARVEAIISAEQKETQQEQFRKVANARVEKYLEQDRLETEKALKQLRELIAPALTRAIDDARRNRRHYGKALKREKQKLAEAARQLARAKMIQFRNRRAA